MSRITRTSQACITLVIALASLSLSARALEPANGSTVVELFDVARVTSHTQYPPAFTGVAWGNLATVHFGSRGTSHAEQSNDVAGYGDDAYVVVRGFDDELDRVYTGLVRFDGTTLHHVLQSVSVRVQPGPITSSTGDEIRGVVVAPVTAGRLVAGHPVVTRHHKTVVDEVELQIVNIDPATGAETLVHAWTTAALNPEAIVAIDNAGTLFALESGLSESVGGDFDDGESIRKLVWNPSSAVYDESRLGTGNYSGGLVVGPDDHVYSFDAGARWKALTSPYPDHQILRIDPEDGGRSTWAWADGRSFIFDWAWSDDGRLWIGMRSTGRKAVSYVAEARPELEANASKRVSTSANDPDSVGTASNGAILVLERPFEATGAVYRVGPGAGGDSGRGGGGKGKKK